MPSKNRSNGTTQTPALRAVPDATGASATGHRTAAEDKLWAALHANPNTTTIHLARQAGVGKSTAGKILATWAADGSVTRTTGITDGGRRTGYWAITDTVTEGQSAAREPANPAAAEQSDTPTGDDTDATREPGTDAPPEKAGQPDHPTAGENSGPVKAQAITTSSARLAPGALRGMVEDFLTEHPDTDYTAGDIARKLNRSAGAIANALVKLTNDEVATLVCEHPRKYRAANTDN